MFAGIGTTEFLILLAMAFLLFGLPSLVAFWIGYRAGSKRSDTSRSSGAPPAVQQLPAEKPETPAEPSEEETSGE